MNRTGKAKQIVRQYTVWAAGGGLLPMPLVNIATVTGLQVSMLERLSKLYDADYSRSTAQMFVSALTGTTVLSMGYRASTALRFVPGIGTVIGSAAMGTLAGASTYAIGQATIKSLETSGDLLHVDIDQARDAFDEAFKRGRVLLDRLQHLDEQDEQTHQQAPQAAESQVQKPQASTPSLDPDALALLERLAALHEKGLLTDAEFDAQKQKLLSRL
jgi:uncharacterized protein (DUF697 family)